MHYLAVTSDSVYPTSQISSRYQHHGDLALFETSPIFQSLNNFQAFYGTLKIVTVFTKKNPSICHCPAPDQSGLFQFNIILPPTSVL
jgi:hypothetical protein